MTLRKSTAIESLAETASAAATFSSNEPRECPAKETPNHSGRPETAAQGAGTVCQRSPPELADRRQLALRGPERGLHCSLGKADRERFLVTVWTGCDPGRAQTCDLPLRRAVALRPVISCEFIQFTVCSLTLNVRCEHEVTRGAVLRTGLRGCLFTAAGKSKREPEKRGPVGDQRRSEKSSGES